MGGVVTRAGAEVVERFGVACFAALWAKLTPAPATSTAAKTTNHRRMYQEFTSAALDRETEVGGSHGGD